VLDASTASDQAFAALLATNFALHLRALSIANPTMDVILAVCNEHQQKRMHLKHLSLSDADRFDKQQRVVVLAAQKQHNFPELLSLRLNRVPHLDARKLLLMLDYPKLEVGGIMVISWESRRPFTC